MRCTSFFCLAFCAWAQSPLCSDIRQIDAVRRNIDAALPHLSKRTFAKVGDRWREVAKSENEVATVVFQNKLVVQAVVTTADESGDWVLTSTSYFRPDGTLARQIEQLDTMNGNARVLRDSYFDCAGKALKRSARHLDLNTKQAKPAATDFIDHAAPVYKRTRDLPFFRALEPR